MTQRSGNDRPYDMGDLLPQVTGDETGESWGEPACDDRDEELRREVPPHHG